MAKFKRILLKLSGESLMGKQSFGIDPERLSDYAKQIKEVHEMGVQIGIVIGGSLQFNGHEIEKMSEKEMRRIRGNEVSIIFQDPMTSLNPVYTVGNQIMEVILLHTDKNRKQARERAKELLTLVGINEPNKRLKQYPHELSGKT